MKGLEKSWLSSRQKDGGTIFLSDSSSFPLSPLFLGLRHVSGSLDPRLCTHMRHSAGYSTVLCTTVYRVFSKFLYAC